MGWEENAAACRRYPQPEWAGALVTAAARHGEPETRRARVEHGGEELCEGHSRPLGRR